MNKDWIRACANEIVCIWLKGMPGHRETVAACIERHLPTVPRCDQDDKKELSLVIELKGLVSRPITEQDISWTELLKHAQDSYKLYQRATERLGKARAQKNEWKQKYEELRNLVLASEQKHDAGDFCEASYNNEDDALHKCTCGADEWNARVKRILEGDKK